MSEPAKRLQLHDPDARAQSAPANALDIPSPESITSRQVIELYIRDTAKQQAPRTLEERKRILEEWMGSYGQKPACKLIPAHMVLWVNAHQEWKSDWTIRRAYATISRPFTWAKRLGLINSNPFEGISHPTGSRGRPVTVDEFHRMLRAVSACFRRVVFFLRLSGARPCEMSCMQWTFIDLEKGAAILVIHKTVRTRKDRAPRLIVLHPTAVKLLRWIKAHQAPGERYVFLNAWGRPWNKNSLGLRLARLRVKAKLPKDAKLYGLRHQFGTDCVLKGVDIATLAELMGHTSTRMTSHYIHLAGKIDHLQEALAKVFGGGQSGNKGK